MQTALSLPIRSHDSQFVDDAMLLIDFVERQYTGLPVPEAMKARLRSPGIPMPMNFWLELSAVGYVGYWEVTEQKRFLATELPPFRDVLEALRNVVLTTPSQFFEIETFSESSLFVEVMTTYFLSYSRSTELGCQLLVGEVDEDILVEAIARLAMEHRHDLTSNDQQRTSE